MSDSAQSQPSAPSSGLRRHPWAGKQVWSGHQLHVSNDWQFQFSADDVDAIRAAVEAIKDKPLATVTRDEFNVPRLRDRMVALRERVLNGQGFIVLRGLAHDEWTNDDLVRAYWGIGTWFGDPVSQNARGHLLGHVINQRNTGAAQTRLYQTTQAQAFHSDSCDIVGLLCMHTAKEGGESSLASSPAVYNELLSKNPSALSTLCGDFHCDRFGEIPEGKQPWYTVCVFNEVNERFVCCGMDPDIRSGQRLDDVPALTEQQSDALDAFQDTAQRLSLSMMLERGDIQLVNNLTVVHARSAFVDFDDADRRRYMVRLWLSSPDARALPDFMAERWGNIKVGTVRGGILVPGATPVVQLDPDA